MKDRCEYCGGVLNFEDIDIENDDEPCVCGFFENGEDDDSDG